MRTWKLATALATVVMVMAYSTETKAQTLADLDAGYKAGPPESSLHSGKVKTPGAKGLAGVYQVDVSYGKFVPTPIPNPNGGPAVMVNKWTPDNTMLPIGALAVNIATGDFGWNVAAPGLNLGGGVAAGRITYMLFKLQKKNAQNEFVTVDFGYAQIVPGAIVPGPGGNE